MNAADEHLVMLGAVASFDIRLRIDIQVWRPIDEPNGKKPRLFCQQSDLPPENPFVRLESAKHRYFSPFRQAQLGLPFLRVCNPLVLYFPTQGEISHRLQILRHDLT